MPAKNGGYDKPEHAMSTRLGRNKEITDDFTMLAQADEAIKKARKSTKEGKIRPGDHGSGEKVVTEPALSV